MKVTACPTREGLSEETNRVLVVNCDTTDWLNTGDVLPVLLASPPYCAVMERVPAVAKDVVRLA